MSKAKEGLTPVVVDSRAAAQAALEEMARLKGQIEECKKAEAEEAAQRAAVELLYSRQEKAVKQWAEKDSIHWKVKTLNLGAGTISFTVSPGKVSLIKKIAKSFEAAEELLRASRSALAKKFLRPQPDELNKELLLQEFVDKRLTNEQLEPFGLRVEKPEVCKIEVNP